jgi:LysM repeat protein
VRSIVDLGLLVPVKPSADEELHQVSFPFGRPEVSLFVDRLASQYHTACGEKLVVTSLTRPISDQPRNASDRSVHPTGMAVDLRRSNDRKCRSWLENVLSQLDGSGVLDATRESRPPHYHVVVFPSQYASHVEQLEARFAESVSRAQPAEVVGEVGEPQVVGANPAPVDVEAPQLIEYTVRRGDSLWTIARRLGTTVDRIKEENDLRTSRIFAGQVITVPAR